MASTNNLLDYKAVRKLSDTVNVKNIKKHAKEWLEMINDGTLKDERTNYIEFEKVMLVDILGYDRKQIKFEKDDIEFQILDKAKNPIICIECKDTTVLDLWKKNTIHRKGAVGQLWEYMTNLTPKFGICTNYDKFILFQYEAGRCKHYEFEFSSITSNEDKLKEFIWIFSKDTILGMDSVNKTESLGCKIERDLEEEFYDQFFQTRKMLVKEFCEHVPRDMAIEQAQVFLNRLIFVMFSASHGYVDKGILVDQIRKQTSSKNITARTSIVYNAINMVFEWFANGHKNPDVFAFNGGLFEDRWTTKGRFSDQRPAEGYFDNAPEKVAKYIDNPAMLFPKETDLGTISPLIKNISKLISYDFQSDLTVNILGHIFEQSLDDIEKLKDDITSERKDNGVYYTPSYVTEYVCRQTIIPYLCKDEPVTDVQKLVQQYVDSSELDILEEKVRSIKILDPACGSGAFLVKAVDILYEIHNEILESKNEAGYYDVKVRGKKSKESTIRILDEITDKDLIRQIIENSIFGIDINPQSVEISRIAMFFKLAGAHKKLPDLSNNIKRGNTILSKKTKTQNPFDWVGENGFPQVCANRDQVVGVSPGFDIIVGNPPYVRQEKLKDKACMQLPKLNRLKGADIKIGKRSDLSAYFYYHCLNWLKTDGRLGFIVSDSWLNFKYGEPLRRVLLENCSINVLLKPTYNVFKNIDVKTVITVLTKNNPHGNIVNYLSVDDGTPFSSLYYKNKPQHEFTDGKWSEYFLANVFEPMFDMVPLGNLGKLFRGVSTNFIKYFVLEPSTIRKFKVHKKFLVPAIPKQLEVVKLTRAEIENHLLVVCKPKAELHHDKDASGLLEYIKSGETDEYPIRKAKRIPAESPALKKKRMGKRSKIDWYYIKNQKPADVFIGKLISGRHVMHQNDLELEKPFVALDTWFCFKIGREDDLEPLLAYMRSSLFSLELERNGHPMGGGALNIQLGDLKSAMVLDISRLSSRQKGQLADAWSRYCENLSQDTLDIAVFRALDISAEKDNIVGHLNELIEKRCNRGRRSGVR